MRITIENEQVKAGIESFGVELYSLIKKENGQELMWEADPAFWGKTSPILFPFIGKMEDFKYYYKGESYPQEKHGFARDFEFKVILQEADRVVFAMESTPETLAKYPFPFLLEVEYRLEGAGLVTEWRVHNRGEETMYFAIGGHPAFACPLVVDGSRDGKRTDSFVKLYGAEDKAVVDSTTIDMASGLTSGEKHTVELKDGVFPITEHIFDSDALIFEKQGVVAAGMLDKNGNEYVRLEAPGCPVWGVWSVLTSDASYVCFEPWWGICGEQGERLDLSERPYINYSEAGKVWRDGYKIVVL